MFKWSHGMNESSLEHNLKENKSKHDCNSSTGWVIYVTRRFERDFEKLPVEVKRRILEVVDDLVVNPFVGRVLRGMPYRRIRVGDYRLIYFVDEKEKRVVLMTVFHRRAGYKRL